MITSGIAAPAYVPAGTASRSALPPSMAVAGCPACVRRAAQVRAQGFQYERRCGMLRLAHGQPDRRFSGRGSEATNELGELLERIGLEASEPGVHRSGSGQKNSINNHT